MTDAEITVPISFYFTFVGELCSSSFFELHLLKEIHKSKEKFP
jgi:hypothetical protein